jgi:hypothetical protein
MTMNNYKANASKAYNRFRDEVEDNPASFFVAMVFLIVLCSLFLKVISVNVEPFLILVGSDVPKSSGIPIIGWGYDVLNLLYVGTGGFLLWALVQLAETMWIFVSIDRKLHRVSTREAEQERNYQQQGQRDDENRYIRRMRRRSIKLPFFVQAASGYIALGAFVFDIIVNWRAYPLLENMEMFLAGLMIGDFSSINWDNAMRQFWNLFSVEILVVAILICIRWVRAHRQPD